jgi:23S rRNA (cytosine1962-C5)-methyltransferase
MIERGETLSPHWLRERLAAAVKWRETIAAGAAACRLVHGEGDGVPSLIVDRYGPYLVVQTLSQGTERLKDEVLDALTEIVGPDGILERNDPKVRQLEGLESRVGVLRGQVPATVEVEEGNVRLEVDLFHGQKTGLFLDQRENHLRLRSYARGHVLDAFSYDGGFALQAAATADAVTAIDVSAECVGRITRNAARNGLGNVTAREGNVFDVLRELHDGGQKFDTVILDPPAFAKSKTAIPNAKRGYKDINLRALRVLRPGGCLVTSSCSYHVHEADFEEILGSAAADAGVPVGVVEKRRQARDHPVLLGVPETYYLKCFILRRLA